MNLVSPCYAYATALFKAEEAAGITTPMMKDALSKAALDDAVTAMKGSSIGAYLERNSVKTFDEANRYLQSYVDDCLGRMLKFRSPPDMRRIAGVYMQKYDVFNIKTALRRLMSEDPPPFVAAGTIHEAGLLSDLALAQGPDDIAGVLRNCSLKAYIPAIDELVDLDLRSVVNAEMHLDVTYYSQLRNLLARTDDAPVLTKAFGIMIDIANLRTAVRAVLTEGATREDHYLRGGEWFSPEKLTSLASLKPPELVSALEYTRYANMIRDIVKDYDAQQDIRAIERISDIHQARSLRELLSPKVFSPAMVLFLLTTKEWEVRCVRLVLKSVTESLPAAEAAAYLEG